MKIILIGPTARFLNPLFQLKLKLSDYGNIVVTLMAKYKIDFKRCCLHLRIFIKQGKTLREHKEALVFGKVMPCAPQKIMDLRVMW